MESLRCSPLPELPLVIPDARIPASLNAGRRHLCVIGPSTPAVVGGVGGWIFDRAMAGWEVTVFIPDLHDVRPLRILGAHADDYGSAVASMENCPGHMALAVAAEVYDDDASVHELVHRMLDGGSCEVAIWGVVRSADGGAGLPTVSYRLGSAAAAFKKHAIAAATVLPASNTADSEVFYSTCAHPSQRGMVYVGGYFADAVSQGRVMP